MSYCSIGALQNIFLSLIFFICIFIRINQKSSRVKENYQWDPNRIPKKSQKITDMRQIST